MPEKVMCHRDCGDVATNNILFAGEIIWLCECCEEVLEGWLKGVGEFHHKDYELKMLRENFQALHEIDRLKRKRWWHIW